MPGHNKVASHRSSINLSGEVRLITREFTVGVRISYQTILTQTVKRIISGICIDESDYPLKVKVSGGLDGSGCHCVYQQLCPNPDLSTQSFLLFGFKVLSIQSRNESSLCKVSSANSPHSTLPVAILALTENQENV